MKIMLFGVSNVGKTTLGTMLAKRLGYIFYDLDEEVKKNFILRWKCLYTWKICAGEIRKGAE